MNLPFRPRHLFAFLVVWLLAAFPAVLPAQGATATGTINGRVYNPATKEYIGNAEVRLVGTPQVAYTESDGSFQFANVAAGEAAVIVNYTGYVSARETFNVMPGETAVREINLVSSAVAAPSTGEIIQLSAFTVSSEREGNSKAIQAQRRNMNISTSVSSDIFGDVADGNVGEFLKYLPGVDLDYVESEARGPRLGGMDSQYVGVSFDGMRTASADANRGGGAASRATSFESAQIANIESIEINWTASPENDADSPAGIVNMKSKRAFDRKGRVFGYNVGANFNSEEFTLRKTPGIEDRRPTFKWKPKYELNYADTFFNRRLGVLISGARSTSYTEQLSESIGYNRSSNAADPRPLVIRQIDFKDGPKFIGRDTVLLTADWRATQRLTLSLNLNYNYAEGHFWNRNFTFVAANDNSNVNNGRSTVGGDGVLNVVAIRAPTGSQYNVAAVNNGGGSSAKLTYTRQYSPRFEYKLGPLTVDGAFAFSRSVNNYESVERGFSNSEGGGVASGWTASRSDPRSWEWTIRQTSGSDWFDLRSFTSTDSRSGGTRVTNDNRTWITEKWTGTGNVAWILPFTERFPTVLKFGSKWDQELRNNNHHSDVDVWSYTGPGGNATTVNANTGANVISAWGNWGNVGPEFVSPHPFDMGTTNAFAGGGVYNLNGQLGMLPRVSRNAVSDLFHNHPELFVNTSTPENYYTDYYANKRDFRQTVTAAFVQSTTKVTSKLQVRAGVRMERTQNAFREFDPLTRAQVLAAGYTVNAPGTNNGRALTLPGMIYQYESQPRVMRHSQYHNYFPSVLTKYNFLPNFEWQAGWNKSIGRQAVDDLTGLWNVNESNQTVSVPNPTLLPEHHEKVQSRLAYYFQGRSPGSLSVSFQRVETTNMTVSQSFSASEWFSLLGTEADPDLEAYRFNTKLSYSDRVVRTKSMDWDYRQTLGFLPSEYLRGTSVQFTYGRTYTSQNVRRYSAPHRISSRLGYSYQRFSGSLGLVSVDNRPNDSTYGRYFGAITKLDLTLSWRLSSHAQLYVEGRNITNVKDEWYESPPGVQEGKQAYLRGMEGYGSNWVFGVRGQF